MDGPCVRAFRLGTDERAAVAAYGEFVREGVSQGMRARLPGGKEDLQG
jgi:hypothetical protein